MATAIEIPRGPLYREKSGTTDIGDGYEKRLLTWRDAALEQGLAEMRDSPEAERAQEYIDLIEGQHWNGINLASWRSRFTDNRISRARVDTIAYLTDIKPTIDVTTKVALYEQSAMVINNVIRKEWVDRRMDQALDEVIDHALLGTGYWKIGCSYPGEFSILACGVDTVIPIQQGKDLQDSVAILYRAWKPPHFFKKRWPSRAIGIEREADPGMLAIQSNQYSRPWNIQEYCLAPHALVQDSCGRIVPISQFNTDRDYIVDSGGFAQKAILRESGRRNEPTIEIKAWGTFGSLPTTLDHKYLTPSGFVEAKDLRVGDLIRRPVRQIFKTKKTLTLLERCGGGPIRRDGRKPKFKPFEVPANFNWGWLFGFYLAEGSISSHIDNNEGSYSTVHFGIDRDEEMEFAASLERALGSLANIGISRHKNSRTSVLRVHKASLARFIAENFGIYKEKHIPDWVWECGSEFCRGIVCGYLEGDGHLLPTSNQVISASIRAAISFQIRELILSLRYGWSKIDFIAGGNRYGRNCQPAYVLRTNSTTGKNLRIAMDWPIHQPSGRQRGGGQARSESFWRYSEDGKYLDVAIEKITQGFSEKFYDLVVESDRHDFLTIHGTVHNSWNSMSPALRYHKARRSPSSSIQDQWAEFPLVELQEFWIDDYHINETGQKVIVKDPYLDLNRHNFWYGVEPGERLYPRKRLLVFAGDRLMYDGPSPYWHGLFPFAKLRINPVVWSSGGLSMYRDLKPMNISINRIGAGIENVIEKAIKPITVSKDGTMPPTSWQSFFSDRAGAKLKVSPIAQVTDVRFIEPPILPGYVEQQRQYLLNAFREQSGQVDFSAMAKKKQLPGGDTIEQFKDSQTAARRREMRQIEVFLEDSGRIAVPCVAQFFSRDQRFRMLGQDGLTPQDFDFKPGTMFSWAGLPEEFHRNFAISIMPGSLHAGSKDRDKLVAMQLFKMQAISLKELYRRLEIGNADQIIAELMQERQSGAMLAPKGKSAGKAGDLSRGARNGKQV